MSSPRVVAVLADDTALDGDLAAALLEDVVDLVAGMQQAAGCVVATPTRAASAESAAWPGMPVYPLDPPLRVADALVAAGTSGAPAVAAVAADVPDLPPLLLGKLFSAVTGAGAAVAPASDGTLVALAAALPVPAWLPADLHLDDPDALARLRAAAPSRGLHVGAGWHRVRTPADLDRLDPGLEGWDATRGWLSRRGRSTR